MPTGLPVLADAKAYLRQTDSTVDDTLIQQLLDRAYGAVQAYLSIPIVSIATTRVIERGAGQPRVLPLRAESIDLTQPVSITDGNGLTVDPTTYRIDAELGLAYRTPMAWSWWGCFPYTVAFSWGLSVRPDYALVVAPAVGGGILDTVADWYQRRSPAATSEEAGGGVKQSFAAKTGLPPRVCAVLDPFRRVLA